MILEMKIPSPGESINQVEIATWFVKNGDYVTKDQIIGEIDSDKATLELAAEESGIITLKAQKGDVVNIGDIVCIINTELTKTDNISTKKNDNINKIINTKLNTDQNKIIDNTYIKYTVNHPSPAAKKHIKENNLNINFIQGTGKDGRIIKQDTIINQNDNIKFEKKSDLITPNVIQNNRKQTINKLSLLRRKLSERLVSVKNETAMLTTFNEVDMSEIIKIRKEYKEMFIKKHNIKLGFMSFFVKATIYALKLYPNVNSMIDKENKISNHFYDISIAISSPKGLMVPIIRNAENFTLKELENNIKNLALKVRENKITINEMTGGTFTITNGGTFGSMLSTPIINPPQSGILGMHNIVERPIVKNNQIIIRPIMYLALSYDHRIIDGQESIGFLLSIKKAIENPIEILMNNNIYESLELE